MDSAFRRQVAEDFDNLLLNREEFAETGRWNDTDLRYVEAVLPNEETLSANGVIRDVRRIVCRNGDLTPWPVPNEEVIFKGEAWIVICVQRLLAHLIIDLERKVS